MSNTFFGAGLLKVKHERLVKQLSSLILARTRFMSNIKLSEIVQIVYACGMLQLQNIPLLDRLAERLIVR